MKDVQAKTYIILLLSPLKTYIFWAGSYTKEIAVFLGEEWKF